MRVTWLSHRTVRSRLTVLYGVLFFVTGALLLAITSGVAISGSSSARAVGPTGAQHSALGKADAQIQRLQQQLATSGR